MVGLIMFAGPPCLPRRVSAASAARIFERTQDVIVEHVDYRGQRDDVPAPRTFCSQLEDSPDEIAVDALCFVDTGR
jgi:hypothetical protein